MPIMGNGRVKKPKYMFVFINPTKRNISSLSTWQGPRFPFIGTKQVWKVFHKAGLFDDKLMYRIKHGTNWSLQFTRQVKQFLEKKSFYFTNIVKWTGDDATLPERKKIELYLPILEREIELIRPKMIIAFGLLPFEHLTKKKIKLDDYYTQTMIDGKLKTFDCQISATGTKVRPCYFPVGRGNPSRAEDILKLL